MINSVQALRMALGDYKVVNYVYATAGSSTFQIKKLSTDINGSVVIELLNINEVKINDDDQK